MSAVTSRENPNMQRSPQEEVNVTYVQWSAYHLNGIFGNSGENSNGTVHPAGMLSGKKVIPFEVFPFSRFDRNARKFLYHLSTITSARENRPFHLFFT